MEERYRGDYRNPLSARSLKNQRANRCLTRALPYTAKAMGVKRGPVNKSDSGSLRATSVCLADRVLTTTQHVDIICGNLL